MYGFSPAVSIFIAHAVCKPDIQALSPKRAKDARWEEARRNSIQSLGAFILNPAPNSVIARLACYK